MLSLLGFLIVNARYLSDYVKESINFTVMLRNTASETEIFKIQKEFDANPKVKSTRFITAEEAALEFQKSLGEDFIDFLGFNPLLPGIEVKLHNQYATNEVFDQFAKKLSGNPSVMEVVYEKDLIHLVNQNIQRIGLAIFGFSILMLLVAIALMNNTVRLVVYSKRFLIRTMQLVGATRNFIRKPFLYRSIWQGLLTAMIALALFSGLLYMAQKQIQEVVLLINIEIGLIIAFSIIVLGILINTVSTYFAVNKYLGIKTDDLF